MADHVLPATHGALATQASAEAFHTKAGALQAQPVWPVSVLLTLYPSVVLQARQAASPASEKVCAGQAPQTVSLLDVHATVA